MPTPFLLNGILASQISGHLYSGPAGAFDALGSVTVGSGGLSSITFSAIPQTYTHLQIRGNAQNNRSDWSNDDLIMYFNGDTTTSHYQSHRLYGNGSGVYADAPTGVAGVLAGYMYALHGSGSSSFFGGQVIDILDYASTTKTKVSRALGGADNNGGSGSNGGQIGISSGLWSVTPAAITSITLTPGNGTLFSQYSNFSLYGIR